MTKTPCNEVKDDDKNRAKNYWPWQKIFLRKLLENEDESNNLKLCRFLKVHKDYVALGFFHV